MRQQSQTILEQALKLTAQERAAVAQQLIQSLDPVQETGVEQAWQEEIQQRIADLDNGVTTTIPWEEVQRRITHGK
ncbi:MAG: addiction module protein [Nitrospirales bacterium]|nr:addiction module protein [Nitrospirales bacterium]